jgi:alkyl hydroperoxide reductase subunit AhpC
MGMKTRPWLLLVLLPLLAMAAAACNKDPAPVAPGTNGAGTPHAVAPPAVASASVDAPRTVAEVGKPAPDFTLKDLDGNDVSLASFKGKIVVLEWWNPGCPFVNKAHEKGGLVGLAKKHAANGVVWLAINSGAQGKQGFEPGDNQDKKKRFGLEHPILRDTTGAVGHLYGATNTPQMFVVGKDGTLVYSGAVDNSPDAEGQAPTGGTLVNYVDAALGDLGADRPVKTPTTRPYGCSVKYGS